MSKSLSRSRLGRTFRGTEEQSRSSETPAASASGPFHHPATNRRSSDSMQSQFPRLSRSSPPPPVWKHAGESRNSGETVRLNGCTAGDSLFESCNVDFWRLDSLRKARKSLLEFVESFKHGAHSLSGLRAWRTCSNS